MLMSRFLVLIFIILVGTAYASDVERHRLYSESPPSDEGIYVFYSGFISDAERILDAFVDEDEEAYEMSQKLTSKILTTEQEIIFYKMRGVETNASEPLAAFKSLILNIEKLAEGQNHFFLNQKAIFSNKTDYESYMEALSALTAMKTALDNIESSVNTIENVEIWNGTAFLHFDTSKLRTKLKEAEELVSYYEYLILYYGKLEGLMVSVSDTNPYLRETVEIRILAINATPLSLHIDDSTFPIQGEIFRYSFNETGEHIIYAEGVKENEFIRSNTVRVHVSKIPTSILLSGKNSAYLNEIVQIEGLVLDYFGKPLNVDVLLEYDGKISVFSTKNGSFGLNVTRQTEGYVNISASFQGSETHEASSTTFPVFFSKYPVDLTISANRTSIPPNSKVEIFGNVRGVEYAIPVEIVVNGTVIEEIIAISEFNSTLIFNESGTYSIQAVFQGDDLYRPSESNIMTIRVSEPHIFSELFSFFENFSVVYILKFEYILAAISLIVILLVSLYLKKKKTRETVLEKVAIDESSKITDLKSDHTVKEIRSLDYTYPDLFNRLVELYNLKKGLTPRELLKALEKEDFYHKLKKVTDLHEKQIYGKKSLSPEEEKLYIRLILEIMEGIG